MIIFTINSSSSSLVRREGIVEISPDSTVKVAGTLHLRFRRTAVVQATFDPPFDIGEVLGPILLYMMIIVATRNT
jgi:hypothetical protein